MMHEDESNSPRALWVVSAGMALAGGAYGVVCLAQRWRSRERPEVGYRNGAPFAIRVVTIDGKPVEVETAKAYRKMAEAAAKEGVQLKVVSGFRTMAEQEYLHGCYKSGSCNDGNLAAKPGYSNHQSGYALDLNARELAVGPWLRAHARDHGFVNTVPSEPWHWEYRP